MTADTILYACNTVAVGLFGIVLSAAFCNIRWTRRNVCCMVASNGEARRLVVQGGVLVDGEKVAAPTVSFTAEQLSKGIVIKKGKKVYHKVSL